MKRKPPPRRHPRRLSDALRDRIVRQYRPGNVTQAALAKRHGVSQASVSRIIREA